MKTKLLIFLGLVTSLLAVGILPLIAQEDLDTLYVAKDGSYEIYHPESWDVDDSSEGFTAILGELEGELITFTIFSPDTIVFYTLGADSAEDVINNLIDDSDIDFIEDDAEAVELDKRDAAIAPADFTIDTGFAVVIQMDNDDYGMVIVIGSDDVLGDNADFIMDMISTYNSSTQAPSRSKDDDETPSSLENYDLDWQDAVEELQDLGLIGTGGSLVFLENSAFFTGQGYFFTPLGRSNPYADIVMAAEIEFTNSTLAEYEECSLLARLVDSGGQTVNTYLQVGIDNEAFVFYFDTEGDEDTQIYEFTETNLDLKNPIHLLFILQDEMLTVYVNGELTFDKVETNDERSGTYGIALLGKGRDARCDGSNIWVYQSPSFEEGVCEVSSSGTVNKRSGPGTTFDRAGTLDGGTVLQAIAQSEQSDGTWWQLEDESWVREDVVNIAGDCANIPSAK